MANAIEIARPFIYAGRGIKPLASGPNERIHRIARYLLGEGHFSRNWISRDLLKGVLLKKDTTLLRGLETEFRAIFASLPLPRNAAEEELFDAFSGNLIALIPYLYPEEGAEFQIPQKIGDRWSLCTYRISRVFSLTPNWFSSPLKAYGLTSENGPPLLTYCGTTYPAGDGFIASLLADFTPLSVGYGPYHFGKAQLRDWFDTLGNQKVCIYGMSLGGALALHTLRNDSERIESIHAYVPPGLKPWDWKREFSRPEDPLVKIYLQNKDLVGNLGTFPEGTRVRMFRSCIPESQNIFTAHSRVNTGSDHVELRELTPEQENRRMARNLLTALHITGSGIVFTAIFSSYLIFLVIHLSIRAIQKIFSRTLAILTN